jgi:hypothetical protein
LLSARSNLVPDYDKESLRKLGPLDRPNLRYLMDEDAELKSLVYNRANTAVFVGTLEYSFGLIQRTPEQVTALQE